MPLLGQQITVAKEINAALNRENQFTQKTIYLAGEMGVGKTYISAQLIADRLTANPKAKCLIVAPSNVITKWQHVLKEFTTAKSTIFNIRKTYDQQQLIIDPIVICSKTNWPKLQAETTLQPDFLIVDEIHQYKKGTKTMVTLKDNLSLCHKRHVPVLLLTGTIFDRKLNDVSRLLIISHPNLFFTVIDINYANWFANFNYKYANDISKFMKDFWQYIAFNLNLAEVKHAINHNDQHDLHQTIAPIDLIMPNSEQKAFYNLMVAQLEEAGRSFENASYQAAQRLDMPSINQPIKHQHRIFNFSSNYHNKNFKFRLNYQDILSPALSLTDIKLQNTQKYQRLTKILKQTPQKTLILVKDPALIKALNQALTRDGFKVGVVPKKIHRCDISHYINDQLKQPTIDAMLINPLTISHGVDINTASQIIWYQLLSSLTTTIQTQRRIYRLSSTKNSLIHYLVYAETSQVDLIKDISNSYKNNAATYGTRTKDNLSKLTGILFETLN